MKITHKNINPTVIEFIEMVTDIELELIAV